MKEIIILKIINAPKINVILLELIQKFLIINACLALLLAQLALNIQIQIAVLARMAII